VLSDYLINWGVGGKMHIIWESRDGTIIVTRSKGIYSVKKFNGINWVFLFCGKKYEVMHFIETIIGENI
jgi:hypothetical protein